MRREIAIKYLRPRMVITLIIISLFLFPIFYIVWGIYNRRNINIWLSILLFVMMSMQGFQFSYILYSVRSSTNVLNPIVDLLNAFTAWGAFMTFCFCFTRAITFRMTFKIATMKEQCLRYMAIVWIVLLYAALLLVIALLHNFHNSFLYRHHPGQIISLEISVFLWMLLVVFLCLKYPHDTFIAFLYKTGLFGNESVPK